MAVDDEILWRNPFNFEMKKVLINDSVRREAFSKRGMENVRKELEQVGEIQPKVVGFSIRREGLNEGRVQSKEQDINYTHKCGHFLRVAPAHKIGQATI